jgi:hypothetical protein
MKAAIKSFFEEHTDEELEDVDVCCEWADDFMERFPN